MTKQRPYKTLNLLVSLTLLALLVLAFMPQKAVADTATPRPGGAGDEANLDVFGATNNWEAVDEVTSDDDTTYVYTTDKDVYTTDLHNLDDVSLSGAINSVTVYIRSRSVDTPTQAGAYTWIKTNGVSYSGSEITLTTSYADYSTVYADNPQTGSAWTWAEIDALQAGAGLRGSKTSGPELQRESRCTQVWVVIDYTLPDISSTPATRVFGMVASGSSYWSSGSAPTFPLDDAECYFTVTNNGTSAVDITISATDFSGGVGWTLAATPGENIVTLKTGRSGDLAEGDMVALTTSDQPFISGLASSSSQKWELKMETPTSFTDGTEKTGTITLTASALLPSHTLWYLHNSPTPPTGDTNSQSMLSLGAIAPTATTLYNYDQDRDSSAGLLIAKGASGVGETDLVKYQVWRTGLGSDLSISGTVTIDLWSALSDFGQGKRGIITIYLRDYDGSSYTEIGDGTVDEADWQGGSSTWVMKTITISGLNYTIPAGNQLEVKLIVGSNAEDNLWFAYDTNSYSSVVKTPN